MLEGATNAGLFQITLGNIVGSGVVAGTLLARKTKTIEANILAAFDLSKAQRLWRQQSLTELFGPLRMQMKCTERAKAGWNDRRPNSVGTSILRKANETALDLSLYKRASDPEKSTANLFRLNTTSRRHNFAD